MAATYVALYRRQPIGPDRLVGASGDPEVVQHVAEILLAELPSADGDPVIGTLLAGRRQALHLLATIRDEAEGMPSIPEREPTRP